MFFKLNILNNIMFLIIILCIVLLTGIQSKLKESLELYETPLYNKIKTLNPDDYSKKCNKKGKDDILFREECEKKHQKFMQKKEEDDAIRQRELQIQSITPDTMQTEARITLINDYNYTPIKGRDINNWDDWSKINNEWRIDREKKIKNIKNSSKMERLNCFNFDKLNNNINSKNNN